MNDSIHPSADHGLNLNINDALPDPAFSGIPPFEELTRAETAPPAQLQADAPRTLDHRRLAQLSASPVARLLVGSATVLRAWQLDLELPASIHDHLDRCLQAGLRDEYGQTLDLDAIHIGFSTDHAPEVHSNGEERFERRLSLRQLGRAVLDPAAFLALKRCAEPDRALRDELPGFTINAFFKRLISARWTLEYEQTLGQFWARHRDTWQTLAKLSFLDGLCRLRARKRIDKEGYALALDALGLDAFPRTVAQLRQGSRRRGSSVCGIALNGRIIPGVFHLKARHTGHCYVHVLGQHPHCREYISDDAPWRAQRVLDALNASEWHRLHLQPGDVEQGLTLTEPVDDVFPLLQRAQEAFCTARLESGDACELLENDATDEDDCVVTPILPALTLIGTLNHWHDPAQMPQRVPTPLKLANRILRKWLKHQHGLDMDPRQVFIRYLRGTSTTPWGRPSIAAGNVVFTPDEAPVALDQALVDNLRVRAPQGYDDHGGRWVVYADPSAAGHWTGQNELPIRANDVDAYLASVDLLSLMQRRLERFWRSQRDAIERSLCSTLIGQALVSLKSGDLSIDDFNLLAAATEAAEWQTPHAALQWSTLGFYVSTGLPAESDCPFCVGLLLLRHKDRPGGLLYQAGQKQPFMAFRDPRQLTDHLARAAADEQWRRTLLNHMPARYHTRLTYILELWAGIRQPPQQVSILRPWLEPLYRPHAHKARQHTLCEMQVDGSPAAFICQGLQRNSQYDAEDSIVTDREVSLRNWTRLAERLQLLLAPLALLIPAASIASLTAGAATLALHVQAAHLPGDREAERRQVLFAILSLGLLQMGPATPRLLRAFRAISVSNPLPGRAVPVATARGYSGWLERITASRKTTLKPFFNDLGPLKTWSVAGNATFGTEPVRVWKLGRRFLLWTSEHRQARTLVVSSHGYYLPWTRTSAVPNGTELRTYAPHGHSLVDPSLHRVVSQKVAPYSLLNDTHTLPGPRTGELPGAPGADILMAGTPLAGRIKNYTLAKFQSERYESYRQISHIVRNSHQPSPGSDLPAVAMDVMTVRNRFGMPNPSLEDLFAELHRHGIHYDRILLLHCRCSALSSLLGRAPEFVAPQGSSPITP